MPERPKDELRQLLRAEAISAKDEAIRTGGQIPSEKLKALEGLTRLVEICDAAARPAPSTHWPTVAALAVSLTIASLLLFGHVSETEIELDMKLSELRFTLPAGQVLAETLQLTALGMAGLSEIQIPSSRSTDPLSWRASDGAEIAVRLSVASHDKRSGTINLAALTLPAGTRVSVRYAGLSGHYRLSLEGIEPGLRANVNGPIQIERSDGPATQFEFTTPGPVLLQPASKELDLDLAFAEPSEVALSPQLPVTNLSVLRVDEFLSLEHPIVRRISTVLSGTLYLESLDGQEHKLRAGQTIQFECSRGQIRSALLRSDHIDVAFHGRVRGMTTGSDEGRRSLMPTLLEWLRARHGLSLLWGSALYFFGVVMGVLRWWRKPS